MNRAFQVLALCISLGMLTFLACRAQHKPAPVASQPADAGAPAVDAAPAAPAEVYFPASKSGGAFLQHQQAPQ